MAEASDELINWPCWLVAGAVLPADAVLQAPIQSQPHAKISIQWIDAKQQLSTETLHADGHGRWCLTLGARPADGPYQLHLQLHTEQDGQSQITHYQWHDLWFGDVIVWAGQSNAGWPLTEYPAELAALASVPPLPRCRFARFEHDTLCWQQDSVATRGTFPTLAFYFAWLHLGFQNAAQNATQQHPRMLGIIDISEPGSALSAWLPLLTTPEWPSTKAKQPKPLWHDGALWQARLAPLFSLKPQTLLWYQGEQDAMAKALVDTFADKLVAFKQRLAAHFDGDLIAVQLAGFGDSQLKTSAGFAKVREQQRRHFDHHAESSPCRLVSAADLGHPTDIHPPYKKLLAKRLYQVWRRMQPAFTVIETTPLHKAQINWQQGYLALPLGKWQQGDLEKETGQFRPLPAQDTPLLVEFNDGSTTICQAKPTIHAGTLVLSLRLNPTRLSQVTALAYGFANHPTLLWYQQDLQDPALYWPLLPARWARP